MPVQMAKPALDAHLSRLKGARALDETSFHLHLIKLPGVGDAKESCHVLLDQLNHVES